MTGRVEQTTALLAALVFLVAIVAAGVMQSDGTTTAAAHTATLIADVGHTLSAKTARFTVTVTSNDPKAHPSTATGIEDFAHNAVDLKSGEVQERLVGGVRYVRLPGQKWVAGPVGGGAQQATATFGQLRLAKSVHVVGQPRLDGVDTTEYAATIDLLSGSGATGPTVPPALQQVFGALSAVPVHVWIDNSHHVRRFTLVLAFGGSRVTLDLRFSNFGVKASITPPPADQLAPPGTPLPATGSGISLSLPSITSVFDL